MVALSRSLIAFISTDSFILNHGGLLVLPFEGAILAAAVSIASTRFSYGHPLSGVHVLLSSLFVPSSVVRVCCCCCSRMCLSSVLNDAVFSFLSKSQSILVFCRRSSVSSSLIVSALPLFLFFFLGINFARCSTLVTMR